MDIIEVEKLWYSAYLEILNVLSDQYHTWIRSFEPTGFENGIFTVVTDMPMAVAIVRQYCLQDIQDVFRRKLGYNVEFQIILDKETTKAIRKENSRKNKFRVSVQNNSNNSDNSDVSNISNVERPKPSKSDEFMTKMQSTGLNLKYKFENFVVGETNKTAYAISKMVAEFPAEKFNPLFIYGGSGLGKTHLMQAIGHYHIFNSTKKKVKYIKTHDFVHQYINNVHAKSKSEISERMTEFRQKFRNVDILLIDDIQFIESKTKFMEELFYILETLLQKKKQIVLTSDRLPRDIPTLIDRLRTRFEMGIVVDIKPPEYETRMNILRKWSDDLRINIPDDALDYIAQNFENNVRELEGVFHKVTALADIEKKPIDLGFVKSVLKYETNTKQITIETIAKTVSEYYGLKVDDLKSPARSQKISDARKYTIYLARELTKMSYEDIANFLNKRHPTMLYSYEKMVEKADEDAQVRETIRELKQAIRVKGG